MQPFPFEINHEVIFHDLDMLGHVNNVTYFVYMETIRFKYMTHFLKVHPTNDMTMVIAEATCQYKAAALYGDLLTIGVGISRVGRRSFEMVYHITRESDHTLIATGKSVQVAYDRVTHRATQLPTGFTVAVDHAQKGWKPSD